MSRPRKTPLSALGQRLRAARNSVEKSGIDDFLGVMGISHNTWNSYLNETSSPDLRVLIRLGNRGVDLNWLATGNGTMFGTSPFSPDHWGEIEESVLGIIGTKLPANQKAAAIVNYIKSLLDGPSITDDIPIEGISTEAGNDDGSPAGSHKKDAS